VLLDLVYRLPGGGEGAAQVEQELLKLAQLPLARPASGPLGGGGVSAISSVRTRYRVSTLTVVLSTALARQQILAPRHAPDSRVTAGSGCRGYARRQVSPADAVLTRFG
jgi:hypothetical protein